MKSSSRRLANLEKKFAPRIDGSNVIILRGVDPNDPENEDAGSAAALFVGRGSLENKSFHRRPGETMREFVTRAQAAFDEAG